MASLSAWSKLWFVLWIKLVSVSGSDTTNSLFGGLGTTNLVIEKIFAKFDKDLSGWWDKIEYAQMSEELSRNRDQVFPQFEIMDTNKDNKINLKEITVSVLSRNKANDQYKPNGKKMTVEEAEARAKGKELPDDMDFDDGKMFKKVDKGEMSLKSTSGYGDVRSADRGSELELLAKKNPSLARFVSLGRFAQDRLNAVGYSTGSLVGLRSSPRNVKGKPLSDDMITENVIIEGLILEFSLDDTGEEKTKKEVKKSDNIYENITLSTVEAYIALHRVLNEKTNKMESKGALISAYTLKRDSDEIDEEVDGEVGMSSVKDDEDLVRDIQLFPIKANEWWSNTNYIASILGVLVIIFIFRYIKQGMRSMLDYVLFNQNINMEEVNSSDINKSEGTKRKTKMM